MLFLFIGLILIITSISSNYYLNSINGLQKQLNNSEKPITILNCIKNIYIKDYTNIHKFNLKNLGTDYRLENLYLKIKPGNSVLYKEELNNGEGLKLKNLPDTQNNLYNFLSDVEECSKKTEYIVNFKDLTYYNNGIVDIPKLNILLYPRTMTQNYETIKEMINNNSLPLLGKIDISENLSKKFNQLKYIMDEIITSITQYSFYKNSNKEKNPFSIKNGLINSNNSILYNPDFNIDSIYNRYVQLNGGQSEFIQSNGVIYIDSYINYCFNENNYDYSLYNCSSNGTNTVNTLFSTDPNSITDFCKVINKDLYNSGIYYLNSTNNDEISNKEIFKDNIGNNHTFLICSSYKHPSDSKVDYYLNDLLDIDTNIEKKAFYDLYYVNNNLYDINNWTDINEKKTFSLRKGENGWIIYISNNKDFFQNKFNIDLSTYNNPFFPDKNFDIFFNNSGFDILSKVLNNEELNETQILKSGSYIEFALPITPDIETANINKENLSFGNHIYKKLIEGMIIY